jgi:ubiquinone/menaquinone biosynthesis C-methylase UbiE
MGRRESAGEIVRRSARIRKNGRMAGSADAMRSQDAFDRIEDQFNTALDESLNPAGPDVLYDYVAEMELPAGAIAIDVGSGGGRQAVELSRRFGLQVTGIDPFPQRADAVRGQVRPADTVSFQAGTAEDLPVPSGSAL